MKEIQLRVLNNLANVMDLDMFYNIELSSRGHVLLQGKIDGEMIKDLQRRFKCVLSTSEMGYLQGTFSLNSNLDTVVQVTLT